MTGVHEVLRNVQLIVFIGAALAGARLWWRSRSRPAALLAVSFATLSGALLLLRFLPTGGGTPVELLRDAGAIGLLAFPWLLALFAWSFESRFPRWLHAAGLAVAALAVWALVLPPLSGQDSATQQARQWFILLFVATWVIFGILATARLWSAGASHPLARSRMRLMALAAFALTLAILFAGFNVNAGSSALPTLINALAIVSALLFLAAFAPPRPLRLWWRRRITSQWQHVQTRLIAAATPAQAAAAVIDLIADTIGGGATIVTGDGELLAHAGIGADQAAEIAWRIKAGEAPLGGDEVVRIDSAFLVVHPTSYTPLFGQDERDILAGIGLQLQLAFERAQLFEDNERRRGQLERAHHDLQAIMVGLAHDLRSPSVAINGYSSLLLSSASDEERAELVAGIRTSSAYLNQLVDSLMELARVGAARHDPRPVDLSQTLAAVADRLRGAHANVTVSAQPLPTVEADPVAVQQVFENLLFNAARHGGRDDLTITVSAQRLPDRVAIMVCDDGRGIAAEERDSVFTPFQRGRSAASGGHGVGLGVVRRIIEAHGGTIELLDNHPGANFQILLPA